MATLAKLMVMLGLDKGDFDSGIDGAVKKSGLAGNSIQGNLAKIGGGLVLGAFGAVSAAAAATGGFLVSCIGPASDLNETMNKSSVVFGKSAGAVETWGKGAVTALGMTQNEAVGAAATYGNLFRSMGMGEQASSDMSMGLVDLAADLGSFNNMASTDVLEKLRAGLTGETEPLKSLGVNISQVTMEAEAMRLKLWNGKGAISAAAKAQATYSLILKQTALAQGDFANTSGGLANQQKILKSSFETIKSTIGGALLPVVNKAIGAFTTWLNSPQIQAGIASITAGIAKLAQDAVAYIPTVISWFKQIGDWFMNNQGVIVAILAVLGVTIAAFAISAIASIISVIIAAAPIILVIALIAAAAYLLYQAWITNFGGIQQIVAAVWAWLQPVFAQIVTWLQTNIPIAIQALQTFWLTVLLPAIQQVWNWVQTVAFPIIMQLITWLQVNIPIAIQALSDFWTNTLLPAILSVWAWMQTNLFPLLQSLGELLGVTFTTILTALAGLWQNVLLPAIQDVGKWMQDNLLPIFKTVGDWISANFVPAVDGIASAFGGVKKWIDDVILSLGNIKLPKWLTPGSPTPFELGLVGIGEAFKSLAKSSIPAFSAEINGNLATAPGIMGGSSGGGGNAEVASLLREMNSKPGLDEYKLAKLIRDAVLQVVG